MRSSRRACWSITARTGESCTTPSPCCCRWATVTRKRSPATAKPIRAIAEGTTRMFEAAVFYAFGAVLLAAGVAVITARNPVHGVLFLVLAFFTAAALWLLLNAEFLAITPGGGYGGGGLGVF